ncbi:MAG: hypothetical protein VKI42_04735, partial [Synechococcaceae cyanobacterium]|nr:hypothetical protein [Synechococcaceae cyanobacterium]
MVAASPDAAEPCRDPAPAWDNPLAAERARRELARFRPDPQLIRALMPLWGWAHRHYFQVTSRGWEHVPRQGPVQFIGSHNGGLAAPDMHMAIYEWYARQGLERPIRGLAHPKLWRVYPLLAQLAAGVGAIPAHVRLARAALEQGSSLLI